MDEKKLGKLNIAKEAEYTINLLEPFLAEQEAAVISSLKNDMRSGENSKDKMLVEVAKLVCIEDLRTSFKSKIKTGNRIRKELEDGRKD